MIVLRKTMDAAIEVERQRYAKLASDCAASLRQTNGLQRQLADWITEKGDTLTPRQMAALFWSHDDSWQAQFFNVLPSIASEFWDALPPPMPNEYRGILGVPAGEGQWCWMADKLNEDGRETIAAMHYHATHSASADTRPEGGDALAAPFTSGAVGEAETPKASQEEQ